MCGCFDCHSSNYNMYIFVGSCENWSQWMMANDGEGCDSACARTSGTCASNSLTCMNGITTASQMTTLGQRLSFVCDSVSDGGSTYRPRVEITGAGHGGCYYTSAGGSNCFDYYTGTSRFCFCEGKFIQHIILSNSRYIVCGMSCCRNPHPLSPIVTSILSNHFFL